MHGLDLFFVFNPLKTSDISDDMKLVGSPVEEELSRTMMDYWTNFAYVGSPNRAKMILEI